MRAGRNGRTARVATLVVLSLALGGCVRGCTSPRPPIHLNPNMDDQPRVNALQASDFFYDGKAMRQPIAGTVAREDVPVPGGFETGLGEAGFVAAVPAAAAEAFDVPLLERGAERYGIYCAPCHGDRGDGQGMLFHRAGVVSADLRMERLRQAPDGQLFAVISRGVGLMPSYAAQVPPADRWAIVAWVRQLQAESPVSDAQPTGAVPAAAVAADDDTPADAAETAAEAAAEPAPPATPAPEAN